MEFIPLNLQYAHSDGHTSICFSQDGTQFLTCGSDGDVRMWKSVEDADPTSECVGELALALAFRDQHFYVGSDNNYVQAYTFPDSKRDGIISRFTAPVTHISIGSDGRYVAAGSCDMEIQVTDTVNSNSLTKMLGHTGPITGVAVDPQSCYIASSSCDGSVIIWDIETGESVKSLPDLFPKSNDFFRAIVLGRPSWQGGSGAFLAIPTGQKVTLYDRDTWLPTIYLSSPKIHASLTLAEFSPCGEFLVAGSTSGELVVWKVSIQTVVAAFEHPKHVSFSCISWRGDSKAIAVCDRLGQFVVLEDWQPIDVPPPSPAPMSPLRQDYADDGENDISIDEIKRASGWGSPKKDEDDASSVSSFKSVAKPTLDVDLQPPFQPSSTPSHFTHRFMVWNNIGIIRCFNTEEEKSIDVEFHDTMFHHTLHINNYEDYTMAALSSSVLLLASPFSEDSPSKLTCILLNAWDGTKEWSLPMPEGEAVCSVAAGDQWSCAATDITLRVFSHGGTQRQPLALPGPVVAMAAHQRKLAVVYHQGIGIPHCQNLGVMVYEVHDIFIRALAPAQPLPLSPRSTLKWVGFTDEGRLCAYDSEGVLRGMAADFKHWAVFSDTRSQSKGPSDKYFIIGVSERYQNIRCVLCKGGFYPLTTPRPTLVEIPLKLPLCDPETERTGMEEVLWRLLASLPCLEQMTESDADYHGEVSEVEKTLKQTVIKLFANACKSDQDLRATEVASFMSEHPLQMALTYASKCGKMNLAEKISNVTPKDWSELRHLVSEPIYTAVQHHVDGETHNLASQRDLFEDSAPRDDVPAPKENKILKFMNDSPTLVMTPSPTAPGLNPFKINKDKSKDGPRGLVFFDKPIPPKVVRNEPIKNPAFNKKTGKSLKSKLENTQPKKPSFIEWFSTNKESLSQEFPELSISDLTKKAMGMFRGKLAEEKSNIEETQESQKRKLEDDEPSVAENAKRVASSKLSAFRAN